MAKIKNKKELESIIYNDMSYDEINKFMQEVKDNRMWLKENKIPIEYFFYAKKRIFSWNRKENKFSFYTGWENQTTYGQALHWWKQIENHLYEDVEFNLNLTTEGLEKKKEILKKIKIWN